MFFSWKWTSFTCQSVLCCKVTQIRKPPSMQFFVVLAWDHTSFFFNFQIHAVWSFSRLNCTRNLPVTNTYIFVNKHGLWSDECSCTSLCGYPDKSGFWRFWFFNRLNIWVSLVFSPLNVHFVCYGLCVQERIGSHQFNLETLYGRNCEGDA